MSETSQEQGNSSPAPTGISRAGTRSSTKGNQEYFTGSVSIEHLFAGTDTARSLAAEVTFEPGARTVWHSHPLGQTLIVTAGSGYIQRWGGPVEEIRTDDVVWFSPGEKHWHGATSTTTMSHIAMAEKLEGKAVEWMEPVTDDQYKK